MRDVSGENGRETDRQGGLSNIPGKHAYFHLKLWQTRQQRFILRLSQFMPRFDYKHHQETHRDSYREIGLRWRLSTSTSSLRKTTESNLSPINYCKENTNWIHSNVNNCCLLFSSSNLDVKWILVLNLQINCKLFAIIFILELSFNYVKLLTWNTL